MILLSWKCSLCQMLIRRTLHIVLITHFNVLVTYGLVPVKIQPFSLPQIIEEGKTIQITCGIEEGDDPIEFSWFKNGKVLQSKEQWTIHTIGRLSVFIINNVNTKHIGNYTCIATNPAGTDSFSSELKVRGSPRWIHEPQDITVGIGGRAFIRCSASGYPKPEIRWKRILGGGVDGGFVTLPETGRVKMDKDGALVIDSVLSEDAGYYSCEASTGVAADINKSVLLTVRGENTSFSFFLLQRIVRTFM
ncbi:Down syndrome cell adhesion molecule-like protein 1 homolog [Limulus polyphemus]|uniref:Down syndrome cell adhesion molecule-like protein 1 homolog n=1 Tax=Limulus polyphemus TaxID=6850 RepID=A0ABM1RXT2_LIMPO|nr:Down syndrome cell adhesion molecule-like protein 1 homolog [Limulus polyphemus]